MSGQHVHFSKFAGPGHDYSAKRYRTQVIKLFDLYEERLATRPYVAGSEYTIADIAAWPWLRNFELLAMIPANIDDQDLGRQDRCTGRRKARWRISPPLSRCATRRATTRRTASSAAGNTRALDHPRR